MHTGIEREEACVVVHLSYTHLDPFGVDWATPLWQKLCFVWHFKAQVSFACLLFLHSQGSGGETIKNGEGTTWGAVSCSSFVCGAFVSFLRGGAPNSIHARYEWKGRLLLNWKIFCCEISWLMQPKCFDFVVEICILFLNEYFTGVSMWLKTSCSWSQQIQPIACSTHWWFFGGLGGHLAAAGLIVTPSW